MIGHPAIYAAQALASGLAVALAARTRAHLPLAILIPFGLACDVALELVGPAPEGWRFGAGVALGTAYPWAVLEAVAVVLGRRKDEGPEVAPEPLSACAISMPESAIRYAQPTPARAIAQALAGWAPCVVLILSTGIRGPALARVYAAAQAVVALALAVTIARWRRLQEPRTATATCAIVCAAAEVANVPAYLGLPSWWSARAAYLACYLGLIVAQAEALCRRSKMSTYCGAPPSS